MGAAVLLRAPASRVLAAPRVPPVAVARPASAAPVALSTAPPPLVASVVPAKPETTPAGAPPASALTRPARTLASADRSPVPPVDVAAHGAAPTTPVVEAQSSGPWPYAPVMKLSYRRFPFARVGVPTAAMPDTAGPSTPEAFDSLSLDFYPISWYLRVGLSTQFGWESSKFDRSGDYFFAESGSVGFQIPGRFTPFVEGLAGAGYMRRRQADGTLPTAFWQVGIDAGVEIYFAKRAYGSLAIGYLHPANLFVMQQSLMSVKTDSWSLKVGIGI